MTPCPAGVCSRPCSRLDAERRALAERTDVTVAAADLNRLKELTDHLGDTINNPLAVILGGASRPATATSTDATTDAAASVRAAVRRINELARKMTRRDQDQNTATQGIRRT